MGGDCWNLHVRTLQFLISSVMEFRYDVCLPHMTIFIYTDMGPVLRWNKFGLATSFATEIFHSWPIAQFISRSGRSLTVQDVLAVIWIYLVALYNCITGHVSQI